MIFIGIDTILSSIPCTFYQYLRGRENEQQLIKDLFLFVKIKIDSFIQQSKFRLVLCLFYIFTLTLVDIDEGGS